ncbi:unnamed protein product, partial [Closterium sp. NIES-53]
CKAKVESFWEFVRQMLSLHDYPLDLILNADQTPLFLEMPAERTLEMKGARTVHVQSAGYEKERVTVMLAVTASGLKLPPYVVFKRKTIPNVPIPAEELVKKAFVTCGISTPIDGSEDHLILAHMRDKVPMPAEVLQAAAEEADAAEEDAEAAAAEEGGVLEEGGEAEEPSDDEWWRPGRFDGEDCEEWHAGDDSE